jgi:hypothetical protein
MADGSRTGSERQGAGHSDREDGLGLCGRKPVYTGCSLEHNDTPKGRGRGQAVAHAKRSEGPD